MDNAIENLMENMAAMVARYLVWLAPEGQFQLRMRLFIHFIKRVSYYVNQN